MQMNSFLTHIFFSQVNMLKNKNTVIKTTKEYSSKPKPNYENNYINSKYAIKSPCIPIMGPKLSKEFNKNNCIRTVFKCPANLK